LRRAWGIPVVASESPRGANDPALGAFAPVLGRADCVLLVGKRVDFTLQFGQAFDSECVFMQIDADELEYHRTRRAVGERLQGTAQADTYAALDALAANPAQGPAGWLADVE